MVAREARYLSGNDIGKTIQFRGVEGKLTQLSAYRSRIWVFFETENGQYEELLKLTEPVTITGKESKE